MHTLTLQRPSTAPDATVVPLDPISGPPGTVLLLDRARRALVRTRRTGRRVAVFVLRDACTTADPVAIRRTWRGLADAVHPDDTVAWITDTTFVVVCNDIRDDCDAGRILGRLLQHTDALCHVGVALGSATDTVRDLLGRAAHRATPVTPTAA